MPSIRFPPLRQRTKARTVLLWERPYGRDRLLNRLRRCLNNNDAASRAAAGYLSLLVQRKVTQRKHAPEPPTPPALLASAGREPNSPSVRVSDKTSECGEQGFFLALGSDTGSRLPPAEAPMLGGGYGSQRQQQHQVPKSGIEFA